jgi:hypothetical protein
MSQDDVERIFAKLEKRIAVELCSFGPNKPYDIGSNDGPNWMRYLPKATSVTKDARAALSAMPQRELLAEALEALSRLITASSHIHHWHDGHDGGMVVSGSHVHALWEETDRARAAADKIRAALTQEKQT